MEGGYIPTASYVDAKSVFAAVTATFIKQPAEKSLLCHAQYLRELLDKRVLHHIFWIDTRDMAADGLTKGAVARDALHEFMEGHMFLRHEYEQWKCKLKGNLYNFRILAALLLPAHSSPSLSRAFTIILIRSHCLPAFLDSLEHF